MVGIDKRLRKDSEYLIDGVEFQKAELFHRTVSIITPKTKPDWLKPDYTSLSMLIYVTEKSDNCH